MIKHKWWLVALFSLSLAILIIYFPVHDFQFLQWDDDYNIYDNGTLQESSFLDFWKAPYMGLYIPLAYSIWSLLFHAAGSADPMVFHIFNVLLHLANSFLVFWIIRKIIFYFNNESKDNFWIPLCGSLIFAAHPLQIGAVAWASGGRDLMSCFFSLLSISFYFDRKFRKDYALSLLFFLLALLCKPGIVSLPIVFVLFDWLLKRKVYAAAPFFALGFSFIPITQMAQGKYMDGMAIQAWYYRPVIALDAIGFYVSKLFLPIHLAVDYGRQPERVISEQLFWPYLVVALFFLAVLFFLLRLGKPVWIATCLSAAALLPVLGLVPFNFQRISTVTDHYMYLPLLGVSLLVSFLCLKIQSWKFNAVFSVFLAFFIFQGVQRIPIWSNTLVFMNDMMMKNPRSHSAFIILGDLLFNQGKVTDAEDLFQKAIQSEPFSGLAAGNLAIALVAKGNFSQVLQQMKPYIDNAFFDSVNQVHPHTIAMMYLAYALSLARTGQDVESFQRYCQVLKYQPREPDRVQATMAMNILKKRFQDANRQVDVACPHLQ